MPAELGARAEGLAKQFSGSVLDDWDALAIFNATYLTENQPTPLFAC